MTKNELRDLVKSHFALVDAKEVTKHNFVEAELIDDTKITNMLDTDFEVGQELHVITQEGEHVMAPAGEHETKSGIILTVSEEGIITGVKHPEEAGEGSLAEMSEQDIAEEVIETAVEEGMTPDEVIEAVKTVIEEVVQPQIEELKKEVMAYKEKMEKVSAEPASQSVLKSKFNKTTVDSTAKTVAEKRAEAALFTISNKLNK